MNLKFVKISYANNRYEVKLPFKLENGMLDHNFLLCKSRLRNLFIGKFRKDPGLFKCYEEIFKDQIERKLFKRAPESHVVGETYYIPHKLVVREEKTTTKLEIVFDESVKPNECHSLNDCLYPDCLYLGSSLTAISFGALLRFRIRNMAFVGDIEKAFFH